MSYLNKKAVLANIKVRKQQGGKYTVFEAYVGTNSDKKAVRLYDKTQKGLEQKVKNFFDKLNTGGEIATTLTALQAADAKQAFNLLDQYQKSLSLTEIVRLYLTTEANAFKCTTTIGTAYAEFLAKKTGTSDEQFIKPRVGKWVSVFGADRLLSDITQKEFVEYMNSAFADKAPKTRNNIVSYCKTFVNWCCHPSRMYLDKNPLKDIELESIEYKVPEYVPVEDAVKLFSLLWECERKEMLAYAILSYFCGIRRDEVVRLCTMPDAGIINLSDNVIRINKTKIGIPRAFPIMPNAVEWMKSFDFFSAISDITNKTSTNISMFAAKNGLNLPKNAGRHSFITYHMAAYGEPMKTVAIAGTSGQMAVHHYNGLAAKKDGVAFFAILPPTSEPCVSPASPSL